MLQSAIRANEAVFDDIETIAVLPSFAMLGGRTDPEKPYIQVRARRVGELRDKLPVSFGGFPVRVVQASLKEQASRVAGMARARVTADSPEARTAWRTGGLEVLSEGRDLVIHVSPEAGWGVSESSREIPDDEFVMEFAAPLSEDAELEVPRTPRLFLKPLRLSGNRKVHPIVAPDDYAEFVLPLIKGAGQRLWFQNQSLEVTKNRSENYDRLLTTLKDKSWELQDFRIIFRDFYRAHTVDVLRGLKEFGFNMENVRVMRNSHTKGILADSRRALLGSHNWTNEGTTYNRAASLLFDDPDVTQYLEQVFSHDWDNLSYPLAITEEAAGVLLFPGECAHPGTTLRNVAFQYREGVQQLIEGD